MQIGLSHSLSDLRPAFESIDVRMVACRDLPVEFFGEPMAPAGAWQPFCTAIRVSSRPERLVRQRHVELMNRYGGRLASDRLRVILDVLPVSALTSLPTGRTIVANLDGDKISL